MSAARTHLDREFPASPPALAGIRAATAAACQAAGCPDESTQAIVLAVNEACMNVIQHAYAGESGHSLRVRLVEEDGLVTASILDHGRPADNADLRPREYADLRPGGLGVSFMRDSMDKVTFVPPPAGYSNCLILSKRLARGE